MPPSSHLERGRLLSTHEASLWTNESDPSHTVEFSDNSRNYPSAPISPDLSPQQPADSERTASPEPGAYLGLLGHENTGHGYSTEDIGNLANTLGPIETLVEENEATRPGPGLWKRQMLVDRSLRGMAALTTAYAVSLVVTCICLLPAFVRKIHLIPGSSSISISHGHCSYINHKSEALKILINIAATTVLGMSNTYQQLITALDVKDLRHVLSKYGDSRVGTNSPFTINRKRNGRLRSWSCWMLLICTSLPVHLLANSLIGFSMDRPLLKIEKESVINSTLIHSDLPPRTCVFALKYTEFTYNPDLLHGPYHGYSIFIRTLANDSRTAAAMRVYYDPQHCVLGNPNTSSEIHTEAECANHIGCTVTRWEEKCDVIFRVQVGLILAFCMLLKAAYMVAVCILSRNSNKTHCMTFGDAVIAARLYPMNLSTECMLNARELHRRRVMHQCHRHCKNPETSGTGDETGHCQTCAKFNITSSLEIFSTPARATKRKNAFISYQGQMGLAQMMALCSTSAVALTLAADIALVYIDDSGLPRLGQSLFYPVPAGNLSIELLAVCVTNFPQFFFSILYLVLIYHLTLINMEHEWGKMEKSGGRLRCSLAIGKQFDQTYYFNLPMKVLIPVMSFSAFVHWTVSLALQVTEEQTHNLYGSTVYSVIAINFAACIGRAGLLSAMTIICWMALSYRRNGYIPSMYGSVRVLCAATGELRDIPKDGHVKWGDLGQGPLYRRAGLSGGPVGEIVPDELYAGCPPSAEIASA